MSCSRRNRTCLNPGSPQGDRGATTDTASDTEGLPMLLGRNLSRHADRHPRVPLPGYVNGEVLPMLLGRNLPRHATQQLAEDARASLPGGANGEGMPMLLVRDLSRHADP